MKVLILSKALLSVEYRRKTDALAVLPGINLHVAVPAYWQEPRAQRIEYEPGPTPNYHVHVLPMRFNGRHHIHYYPTFGNLVRQLRPDVVHVDEESFNLATFIALWQAHRVGAKTCCYNYANIERVYPPPFGWFERYAFTNVAAALACSHEAGDIMRAHGYRGPLHIIPQTGVDPLRFVPRPDAHRARTPFTIGYVGRLVPEKGVRDLLDALAPLPDTVHLRIVGSGSDAESLKAHAATRGLDARITWQAPVPTHAMPAIMQQCDALVLPSRTTANWKEQFGRVLIEAMACGVPVVGSNSGEIPHVVGDGGLIYAEGECSALATHLMTLMHDTTRYAQISHHARQRVLTHYTQHALAQRYADIYREMHAARVPPH